MNLSGALLDQLRAQAGPVWVFSGARDQSKHRTRQAVWADVKRAAKAFRLPQNVGVHSIRKVYAVDMVRRSNGDLRRVQRALNHADLSTTMVYAMAAELIPGQVPTE